MYQQENFWNPYTKYRGHIQWTPHEIQRLYNSYKEQEKETLLMLFPDRTWQAILSKASRIKITTQQWTSAEDHLIEEMIAFKLNYKAMTNFLPHRSYKSIKARGCYLKRRKARARLAHNKPNETQNRSKET